MKKEKPQQRAITPQEDDERKDAFVTPECGAGIIYATEEEFATGQTHITHCHATESGACKLEYLRQRYRFTAVVRNSCQYPSS